MLITVVLVALAVTPAAASAQGPPDERDRFTDEFVDEDFCGTGVSVDVVENSVVNVWGLEGEDTFKLTFRSRIAFTYGDTTVFLLNAGRLDVERVTGEYPGPRTDLAVDTACAPSCGSPEKAPSRSTTDTSNTSRASTRTATSSARRCSRMPVGIRTSMTRCSARPRPRPSEYPRSRRDGGRRRSGAHRFRTN